MMRKVLLLILVLIGGYSYGQVYQQMSQYGVEFKRMDNDSVLRIPRGLGSLRSISGYDTAQIRYNVSDSSVYVHTGNGWIKVVRGADADSSVFATVHKLYTTIDSLGNLIISENLGNTNLVQDSVARTYDANAGNLEFVNLDGFKIRAGISDSIVIDNKTQSVVIGDAYDIGGGSKLFLSKNIDTARLSSTIIDLVGGNSNIQIKDDSIITNANNVSINSAKITLNATDSIVITQTPPTLTTDYDVLVRDENTGKVGIATISGGVSAFVSDSLRAATSQGVNIKNSVGTTVANFGAANTTNATLYGATAIHGVATLDSTLNVDNLTTLGRLNIKKDSVDIVTDKKWALVIDTANNEIDRQDLDELYNDPSINLFAYFGSEIRSTTVPLWMYNSNYTLVDGRAYFQPQRIKKGTYTGFKFGQNTQGNYTGDAANQIGIYSYSGGTLTLIDTTTRDTELWKSASVSVGTKNLNSTLTIPKDGNYIIGVLYNSSAQTTAPRLLSTAGLLFGYTGLFTNSASIRYVNAQSVLPSSIAMSAMSGTDANAIMCVGLY